MLPGRIPVFRTLLHDPWNDWPEEWLRQWGLRGRLLCVRFPGLFQRDRLDTPTDADDPVIRQWEAAMKRLLGPRRHRIAFAVVRFNNYPATKDCNQQGMPFDRGLTLLRNWDRTRRLCQRAGYLLRMVRAHTGLRVAVHVEDFSAHWVLESGFQPEYWVMDNPMVTYGEVEHNWPDQFARRGYLRRSRLERLRWWELMKMYVPQTQLMTAHLPIDGVHGAWHRSRVCCGVTDLWEQIRCPQR